MKSIKKILFIMAALAATLAFVSCSNGDDDGPSTVAVYKATESGAVSTITFLSDGTWACKVTVEGQSQDVMSGTYKGDPSTDGKITLKITKSFIDDGDLDLEDEDEFEIKNGGCNFYSVVYTRQ